MTTPDIRRIDHPSAWTAGDFASPDDFAVDLTAVQRRALADLARRVVAEGRGWSDLTPRDESLPDLAETLAGIRREVYEGRGLVLLRGLPFDELGEDEAAVAAWAVGGHFGHRATQSAFGDRMGRVEVRPDIQQSWRGYRSAAESRFHTDHVDGLALACVRPAVSGGASRVVSAAAVHNVFAAERPDLLAALYEGYPLHWFAEPPVPGDKMTALPVPVFSWAEGRIVCVLLPSYMRAAAEERGTTLPGALSEAIDAFYDIAGRDGMALEMQLATGDMLSIDNKAVLHGRAAFTGDAGRRLLFRLWFEAVPARPAHPGVAGYYAGLKRAYGDPAADAA